MNLVSIAGSLLVIFAAPVLEGGVPRPLAIEVIEYPADVGAAFKATYFRVGAATPLLSSRISLAVLKSARVDVAGDTLAPDTWTMQSVRCTPGLMTTAVVSWACHLTGFAGAPPGSDADGPGSFSDDWTETWSIVGDALVPLDLKGCFKPAPDLRQRIGKRVVAARPDALDPSDWLDFTRAYLRPDGIAFFREGSEDGPLEMTWDDLEPLLAKPPHTHYDPADQPEDETFAEGLKRVRGTSTHVRFEDVEGGVRDALTGLVWADRDNGADITMADAITWVAAYRGGGQADWRMPTLQELTTLRDLEDLHKDKTDCFGGRYAIALTPLIDASCALVWASDGGFGFVFGKHYRPPKGTSKNYRAIAVRGATAVR